MLAIIPARGGSKGLPGKNIKNLCGKPLIAYSIESALNSDSVTKVFVSTDDPEIAEIAKEFGAECPYLRPSHLATDDAKAIDVLKFTLEDLGKRYSEDISEFMVLQPTSPLRTSTHIDEAVALFRSKNADSVISYCKELHPILWHKYINQDNSFENIFEEKLNNRQDLRETYFPNGAIYIYKSKIILQNKYYTEASYAYIMERNVSVDIDSLEDFEYAEFLFQKNNIKN